MTHDGRREVRPRRWPGVRSVAALLALSAAALPTMPLGAQDVTLMDQLLKEARTDGNLAWHPTRRVNWADFRGEPHRGSTTAAETSSGVSYRLQCSNRTISYAVLATFSTTESWVRPDIPGNAKASRQTLQHERTHFDITELFARRLRRALQQTAGICPKDLKKARRLFDQLRRDSEREQQRYDRETAHGISLDEQGRWDRLVAARLDSLATWVAPASRRGRRP